MCIRNGINYLTNENVTIRSALVLSFLVCKNFNPFCFFLVFFKHQPPKGLQMKMWLWLPVNFSSGLSSSSNCLPYMEAPPRPIRKKKHEQTADLPLSDLRELVKPVACTVTCKTTKLQIYCHVGSLNWIIPCCLQNRDHVKLYLRKEGILQSKCLSCCWCFVIKMHLVYFIKLWDLGIMICISHHFVDISPSCTMILLPCYVNCLSHSVWSDPLYLMSVVD